VTVQPLGRKAGKAFQNISNNNNVFVHNNFAIHSMTWYHDILILLVIPLW